jgi:hypothetical protein
VETYTTHEGTAVELLHRPHAITTEDPVSNEECELTPSVFARQRAAIAHIAHDFRVRAQRGIVVKIRLS